MAEQTKRAETTGVSLTERDGVAYLALESPPLNILTAARMTALADQLERIRDHDGLKALVVRATGRAFSAGADVGEHAPEHAPAMIGAFSRLFRLLGESELPIVMLVEGAALGAGFELALMADVLLATDRASFGQPEIRLGFIAPVGLAALPARVGIQRAIEITSTGRHYSATEMQQMGLVRAVVPADDAEAALEAVLDDLRNASPLIMRMNVRTLRAISGRPFEQARLEAERVFLEELVKTEDVREGIASFNEKRKPVWKNR